MVVPKQVFLDRNILSKSIIIDCAVEQQLLKWGDTSITSGIHGYGRKRLKNDWTDDEVACLPTIALLVTNGLLKLYVGGEVRNEGIRARGVGKGTAGDLFRNIDIGYRASPIDISYFKSLTINQISDGRDLLEFCETLIKIDVSIIKGKPEIWNRFPEYMKANFNNIPRLKKMLEALNHKQHWRDAFHLWSAECYEADYFLSIDQRFINVLTKTATIELPVPIVKPSELLEKLEVREREPLPFEIEEFINFSIAH